MASPGFWENINQEEPNLNLYNFCGIEVCTEGALELAKTISGLGQTLGGKGVEDLN